MGVKVDFSLRRQVLYPTELRAQPLIVSHLQSFSERRIDFYTGQWQVHAAISNSVRPIFGHLSGEIREAMNCLNTSLLGKDRRKYGNVLRKA